MDNAYKKAAMNLIIAAFLISIVLEV